MKTLTKTIFALSLTLAFALSSFSAVANTNDEPGNIFDPKKMSSGLIFDLDHISEDLLKFRLNIHQPEKHLYNITIYDKDGNQLYTAYTSKTDNSQLFNLEGLGYGEYIVEINSLGETASDRIVLKEPEYLRPMGFIKESEKIKNKVTIVSLNTESTVKVKITDSNGKKVYVNSYYLKNYREHLDLNWLPKGEYTMTMTSDNFSETENITIK
ncbi:T9SS type A sorting domain-containing protein [Mangrovivirga cuniculi]|uniref:Secretion system C-terminal sorting domain-containing protein n=1 Tax=Mangrovivirga cuniculi TaxID=2715131 RepID=A0A4D7JRW8_9BACT|nr:T9SS type A sorting domain-containing protein [Mangrovivirga cuniculi]QCK16270.1 hypothetical protein DCC35_16750 [Mangrovivirga cuniculi]